MPQHSSKRQGLTPCEAQPIPSHGDFFTRDERRPLSRALGSPPLNDPQVRGAPISPGVGQGGRGAVQGVHPVGNRGEKDIPQTGEILTLSMILGCVFDMCVGLVYNLLL